MKQRSLLLSGLAALGFAVATHTLARRTRPDHRYVSVFTRRLQGPLGDTDQTHTSLDRPIVDRITNDIHKSALAAGLPNGAVATDAQPSP